MRKPAIPPVPKRGEDRARFDQALRENIEILTARRVDAITPLEATATQAEQIAKINEVIARLQG